MIRALILSCIMVSLAACASTPGKALPQLQNENNALIQGINQSYAKKMLYALPGIDAWASYGELFFYRRDGTELAENAARTEYPDTMELLPGSHTLAFLCQGRLSKTSFQDMVYDYEITVEAGHIYQMTVLLGLDGCELNHVDITNGQPVEVFSIYREEKLHIVIEPTYWKPGHRKRYSHGYIRLFVPIEETANKWSKLLTIQFYRNDKRTPLEFVTDLQAKQESDCPGTEFELIEQRKDSITYGLNSPACGQQQAQSEIARIYEGEAGLHRLSYSENTTELTSASINRYMALFDKSYVMQP